MQREKFNWRREGRTINITHKYRGADPKTYCVSYARLPSGRIGEVWVNSINGYEKQVNDDIRDTCITLSHSLQYGDTLEKLAKSIQREKGRPIGWMGTIIDALIKEPVDA